MTRKKKSKSKTKSTHIKRAPILSGSGINSLYQNQEYPPEGFRSISVSQAIMKLTEETMKIINYYATDLRSMNKVIAVTMPIWNIISAKTQGKDELKKEAIKQIKKLSKVKIKEAEALFENIKERFEYLSPINIQPENPSTVFYRKEIAFPIKPYKLNIPSGKSYSLTKDDNIFLKNLNKLDNYIENESDYSEYEDLSFEIEGIISKNLEHWMKAKGFSEEDIDLAYDANFIIGFVYHHYDHESLVLLKNMNLESFEEFYFRFLLRKMAAKPNDYPRYIPALKLLFLYLDDIGYTQTSKTIKIIEGLEDEFIEMLKDEFT